ncbi:hypothetical protein ACFSKU_11015 [Pontibacter silvestris]|uniref:Transposase n=1 Tax=Pontibacter silvestris TaxID=2305183 RepID=A0ABW4WXQ9_9BACT
MKIIKQSVGADIAKGKFDACFSVLTHEQRVVVKAALQILKLSLRLC